METKERRKLIDQYVSDLGKQMQGEANTAVSEPALGLLSIFLHTMLDVVDSIDGFNSGTYSKLDEIGGDISGIDGTLRAYHEAENGSMS
ncbi:hypothetical protein P6F35_gp67 [Sphingomonas phage vB_StuS_MMDA13]|uniref:Uncharacterized protein n=1 Tax=Sphingomonas phage vB_StuS_MMDA13 TaxID=2686378 RepID=A0A7G3PHR0_9CAUD|nr:hypothetical protein P6F35_gp67 [Sphingomonas phage vB_StuS_MMDA13]QHB80500.1 hypothetical protein MMDA13_gp67 [Sphingomonas phage vB_StuS_MMDA13]